MQFDLLTADTWHTPGYNRCRNLRSRRCLQELFVWRFMQTDPNFSNFLYDEESRKISLIDFGAARHFPKSFVDDYVRMVKACGENDREEIIMRSTKLGFLTGAHHSTVRPVHSMEPLVASACYHF